MAAPHAISAYSLVNQSPSTSSQWKPNKGTIPVLLQRCRNCKRLSYAARFGSPAAAHRWLGLKVGGIKLKRSCTYKTAISRSGKASPKDDPNSSVKSTVLPWSKRIGWRKLLTIADHSGVATTASFAVDER